MLVESIHYQVELVLGELQLGALAGSATDDRLRLGLGRKGLLWAVSCTGTVGWGGETLVGKTGSGEWAVGGFSGVLSGSGIVRVQFGAANLLWGG